MEFCSGTGGLTAQLRKAGLVGSFGVDHIVKAGNKAPIVKVDIATPDGEELARSYINSPLCAYAHFGLPCGTSSRAREIAMPDMPRAPAPLRHAEHPDGIPNLPAKDAERVAAANRVYAAGCRLIVLCILRGVRWSLEQPARSWFWATGFWHFVLTFVQPLYVTFHSCMFGGQRPKKTTIATDINELTELACECTNQHSHLPWGYTPEGFATATEVEYPLELCKQWAAIVVRVVERTYKGALEPLPSHPD